MSVEALENIAVKNKKIKRKKKLMMKRKVKEMAHNKFEWGPRRIMCGRVCTVLSNSLSTLKYTFHLLIVVKYICFVKSFLTFLYSLRGTGNFRRCGWRWQERHWEF